MTKQERAELDARLREIGVDPNLIVEDRDAAYILDAALDQPAVACTLATYRYPETLAPGDRAPDLELHRVGGQGSLRLADLIGSRPVLLVFGSYT